MNKDALANLDKNISKLLIWKIDFCKSVAGTVDKLKAEQ
jgi:hypothetical protein